MTMTRPLVVQTKWTWDERLYVPGGSSRSISLGLTSHLHSDSAAEEPSPYVGSGIVAPSARIPVRTATSAGCVADLPTDGRRIAINPSAATAPNAHADRTVMLSSPIGPGFRACCCGAIAAASP